MRILITGARGLLGRHLVNRFSNHEVFACDKRQLDVTSLEATERTLRAARPDVVIHCAAMTQVDLCERQPHSAFAINEEGCRHVAIACQKNNARLIAISTDYVFCGDRPEGYDEFDEPEHPLNVYGQSKLAGEKAIFSVLPQAVVVRTSWLYGKGGPSFYHAMLAKRGQGAIDVVDDQIGCPTSTEALGFGIEQLLTRTELKGLFHLACQGQASWFDFACEIFRLHGSSQIVRRCRSAALQRAAARPAFSILRSQRCPALGLKPLPHWKLALQSFKISGDH